MEYRSEETGEYKLIINKMKLAFSNIVEAAYSLPISGKLDLKKLLEYNIVEERRNEIAKEFRKSKEDLKNGKLKFFSTVDEMNQFLYLD